MKKLDDLLQQLNFTQYEAQCLNALIQYHTLDASGMSETSQVPKPKIYETMNKLKQRKLIDIIQEGRKKIFRAKSKEIIMENLLEYARDIDHRSKDAITLIEEKYGTKEATEVPFIGIAGFNQLQDYINSLIDTAANSITCFLNLDHFTKDIINTINRRSKEIEIKIIFQDSSDIQSLKEKIPNVEIYQLNLPAFDIAKILIKNLINKDSMKQIISQGLIEDISKIPKMKDTHGIQIFNDIAENIETIFGIMLIDGKKSFFKVPIPVSTPMAIVSTLPEIIEFHLKGLESILNVSSLCK